MIHIRKDLIDAEMLKGNITIIGKASVEFFHAFRKLQIAQEPYSLFLFNLA